ncbi:MAG: glycosyltransferase [Chloroflexota bacterium]
MTIIAGGSRGNAQPYFALSKGLKDAGHTASLVTMQDFEALALCAGMIGSTNTSSVGADDTLRSPAQPSDLPSMDGHLPCTSTI